MYRARKFSPPLLKSLCINLQPQEKAYKKRRGGGGLLPHPSCFYNFSSFSMKRGNLHIHNTNIIFVHCSKTYTLKPKTRHLVYSTFYLCMYVALLAYIYVCFFFLLKKENLKLHVTVRKEVRGER